MPSPTRELLIDAAEHLLDTGGPGAVTLRAVGARAGVSHNAPYKHFASREALLAAVAARELARRAAADPDDDVRARLHRYVDWARRHPARFKLVFGPWSIASEELGVAASAALAALHETVVHAQARGELPAGDPERLAALLRATAHGAADLAAAGHLARDGKGHADPDDLIDDLLDHLRAAAARRAPTPGS
jgi:AcrR family transcriptional regulator